MIPPLWPPGYRSRRDYPCQRERQDGGADPRAGDVLRVGGSASAQWSNTRYLTIQGTATRIPLGLFKLGEVRQACTAKGRQFR